MVKKIPTKTVAKQEYIDYLEKAQGFLETMKQLQKDENWNSTALEGIHAAILAADAAVIYAKGYKSSSDRHSDMEALIAELPFEESKRASHHLAKILNLKNLVEYSGDSYLREEAQTIAKQVERFFDWVRRVLKKYSSCLRIFRPTTTFGGGEPTTFG